MKTMPKQILIAEDDQAILEVLKIILETQGYTVLTSDNEQTIHQLLEEYIPDMIFLDIWLAGEDGGKIAKNLKTKKETKSIPIIIISANNETEKISKEAGADDFLLKPFNIDDLLNTIKKHSPKN